MLVPLLAAAVLLAQTPTADAPPVKPKADTALPVVISVPPIPYYRATPPHLTPSRTLIPLTATITLDSQAEQAREEEDLFASINNERTSRGLGPLASDPLLVDAARTHSREMCALNYFAHLSPTPGDQTPIDRYLDALHTAREKQPTKVLVGENIFYASITSAVYNADYAHQSLMASPVHRANILQPAFTKVGVGMYRDPAGEFWVTEMFLRDN